jgi:hypothetical protein
MVEERADGRGEGDERDLDGEHGGGHRATVRHPAGRRRVRHRLVRNRCAVRVP